MPRKGDRKHRAWLAEAQRLAAEGLSRRAVAERLGMPAGTVCRVLWECETPDAADRERARKRQAKADTRRLAGVPPRNIGGWTDQRLTETWAQRKARRAAERG